MAPRAVVKENDVSVSGVLNEHDAETVDGGLEKPQQGYAGRRKIRLVWRNIILFAYLHLAAVYGLWLLLTSAQLVTSIFGKLCITSHRTLLTFRFLISHVPLYT